MTIKVLPAQILSSQRPGVPAVTPPRPVQLPQSSTVTGSPPHWPQDEGREGAAHHPLPSAHWLVAWERVLSRPQWLPPAGLGLQGTFNLRAMQAGRATQKARPSSPCFFPSLSSQDSPGLRGLNRVYTDVLKARESASHPLG